jgi:hypothetical protein
MPTTKIQYCPWPVFCSGISKIVGMPENVDLRYNVFHHQGVIYVRNAMDAHAQDFMASDSSLLTFLKAFPQCTVSLYSDRIALVLSVRV